MKRTRCSRSLPLPGSLPSSAAGHPVTAFKMADTVLYEGIRGVTDLIVNPGLVNLDFADVRAIMTNMGRALMGTGASLAARSRSERRYVFLP